MPIIRVNHQFAHLNSTFSLPCTYGANNLVVCHKLQNYPFMIFFNNLVYCLLQRWNVIAAKQCSFALIGKILKLQNLLQIFKTGFNDNRFIHRLYFHFQIVNPNFIASSK